jgi:hypothetical protein
MDATNIEYRLQQLENERLPRRVAEVEFITAQLQGEVTAVKEIARGIGVKLDAGIEKLTSHSEMEIGKLQSEQTKALSFLRGVMWVFGVSVGFIGFVVLISPVLKKLLAS